ncbi:MAG: cobalamin-dependent protein [Deltaproteobacteria bacterium]|nr:MAG: cobalamin-dependent protein [Deltaproteobacteria bacterium]
MSEEILRQLHTAIAELSEENAKDAARRGVESGLDPLDLINNGIRSALDVLGDRFSAGDLFLPELVLAAKAADAAVEILEPELLKQDSSGEKLIKVLIATVQDDIHDIGKNIVTLLMKAAGFEVVDFGVNRSSEDILATAMQNGVAVIGLSALLTTTMPHMREFIELLQESGERDRFKVIVGGGPVTREFADEIGADGYGADATRAVEVTKQLMA